MSIHDVHHVELPFATAANGFVHFVDPRLLEVLVLDAWETESAQVGLALGRGDVGLVRPRIEARMGSPRARHDALVVPIAWREIAVAAQHRARITSMEADLELVAFGPGRCHLHVLGVSAERPGTPSRSATASLEQRLTVAVVRHVLVNLAAVLERSADNPG